MRIRDRGSRIEARGSRQFKLERVTAEWICILRMSVASGCRANNKAYYRQLSAERSEDQEAGRIGGEGFGLWTVDCVNAPGFVELCSWFLFYFVAASKYLRQSWFACLNTFSPSVCCLLSDLALSIILFALRDTSFFFLLLFGLLFIMLIEENPSTFSRFFSSSVEVCQQQLDELVENVCRYIQLIWFLLSKPLWTRPPIAMNLDWHTAFCRYPEIRSEQSSTWLTINRVFSVAVWVSN